MPGIAPRARARILKRWQRSGSAGADAGQAPEVPAGGLDRSGDGLDLTGGGLDRIGCAG